MKRYAGSPPPSISILSTDLLEMIFHELVELANTPSTAMYPHHVSSFQTVPHYHSLTLSHVCRLWRNVALEMGRLWSKVFINRREMALHYLAHSKQTPLDLFHHSFGGTCSLDLGWLGPYSPRFRGLNLTYFGVKNIQGLMEAMPSDLPLLEAFTVSQIALDTNHPLNLRWKFRAPSLRSLALCCDLRFNLRHFLSFLKETPLLRSVELRNIGLTPNIFPLEPDLHVVDLRHVQDWELEDVSWVASFLARLDISPRKFLLLGSIIDLEVPFISLTTKEQLLRVLAKHTCLSIEVFGRLTIQFPAQHTSFEISHTPSSDNFLPLFLEHLGPITPWSSLTLLELSAEDENMVTPKDVWDNIVPAWSTILSSLVNVETIRISSPGFRHLDVISNELCERGPLGGIRCPCLSTLQLHDFDFSRKDFDWDPPGSLSYSLVGFTSRRKDLGSPLRSLVLSSCASVGREILEALMQNVGIVNVKE